MERSNLQGGYGVRSCSFNPNICAQHSSGSFEPAFASISNSESYMSIYHFKQATHADETDGNAERDRNSGTSAKR